MFSRIYPGFRWHVAAALAAAMTTACDVPTTRPELVPLDSGPIAAVAAPPVTLEWHEVARNQVAANNMNALAAARLYAAVSVAQARAVAEVDASSSAEEAGAQAGNGEGYGAGGRALAEARRGAVAGASVRVLGWFSSTALAALEQRLAAQGEVGPGDVHPQFTRGVAIGRAVGDAMIARLASDGFTSPWTGTMPSGPGLWTTATLPPGGVMLGAVTPYFLDYNSQFRPPPPPAFQSPAFNADLAQLVTITTNLTPAQRAIALGWAYGANTFTPIGYWDALGAQYVAAAGLDDAAATRVFAMMHAAVFDALIACFEAKYHYWLLRPHQADPAVVRQFAVPNYPAYPSGHASVSSSAARVLARFFPARTAELNAKLEEAMMSRIYAGIHYFFDMSAARTMGEAVADHALAQGLP